MEYQPQMVRGIGNKPCWALGKRGKCPIICPQTKAVHRDRLAHDEGERVLALSDRIAPKIYLETGKYPAEVGGHRALRKGKGS